MDEAPEGVIYFSLGSYIQPNMLKEHVRRAFEETFKKVKYRVIWKQSEPVEGATENILQKSWLPQNEILGMNHIKPIIIHRVHLYRMAQVTQITKTEIKLQLNKMNLQYFYIIFLINPELKNSSIQFMSWTDRQLAMP